MPQHVVLGHHEGPRGEHHRDAWHQFEGLVGVLVAVHAVAFLFWAWLLYKSREARRAGGGAGGWGGARKGLPGARATRAGGGGPGGGAKAAAAGGYEWRTPRDILAAQQQKARLGKV